MKRKTLWIIPVLGLLLGACGPSRNQCGIQYNAERQRVGLPVIPSNWQPKLIHQDECTWINPDYKDKERNHIPVHWAKYVSFREDTLIFEDDMYFGPQDFTTADGTRRDEVFIRYYYPIDGSTARWEASLWTAETLLGGEKMNISLEEADQVLRKWGIDRLTDSAPQP